jgi:hypothetical protein
MQQTQLQLEEYFLSNTVFKVADDILFRKVEDEAVLLHIPTGMYYSLNDTSIVFWEALCNQQPLGSVIEKITAEYEVEYSQVLDDLKTFLQDLSEYGLISRSSD